MNIPILVEPMTQGFRAIADGPPEASLGDHPMFERFLEAVREARDAMEAEDCAKFARRDADVPGLVIEDWSVCEPFP